MTQTSKFNDVSLMSLEDVHAYINEDRTSPSNVVDRLATLDEVLEVMNEGKADD